MIVIAGERARGGRGDAGPGAVGARQAQRLRHGAPRTVRDILHLMPIYIYDTPSYGYAYARLHI